MGFENQRIVTQSLITMAPVMSFVAKHAFAGDVRQAQISFPQGATLTAKSGQEGNAWWWGSFNGREGWFPPAYVTATSQIAAPAFTPHTQQSMQQKMQQVTFTSSVQQQQARQASVPHHQTLQGGAQHQQHPAVGFGQPVVGFGQLPAIGFGQQPPTLGFAAQPGFGQQAAQSFGGQPTGFRAVESDPFAGLDLAPAHTMPTSQNLEIPTSAPTGGHPFTHSPMTMNNLGPIQGVTNTRSNESSTDRKSVV